MSKWSITRWNIPPIIFSGLVSGLIAAIVAYTLTYRQMQAAIKYQQISLSRDLSKEFYQGQTYQELRNAIEACKPLYNRNVPPGVFSHDQINVYLDFFDDLGFYLKQGFLTLELVNHLFGAYLIEAYEYPELRKYVAGIRSSMEHPQAFNDFQELAEQLERAPNRQRQVQVVRDMCRPKKP
jgi:hypothetical protein